MFSLSFTVLCVLLGSAFCSMTEAAILSLPLHKARMLLEQKRNRGAKAVVYLKENMSLTISAIAILNNAINIMGSIYVGNLVTLRYGDHWIGAVSALLTFLIIVLGEIIPKSLGERFNLKISLIAAKPIRVIIFVLGPITLFFSYLSKCLTHRKKMLKVTEEEIKMMLKLGRAEGTVEMDEETLCNRVFKLNDLVAGQIMRPIDELYTLPADKTLGDLKINIINSSYSRIGVYDRDPRNIIGVVQQRLLLREIAKDNYSQKIRDFMMNPIFVSANTKADDLLKKFQLYSQHLFIVRDSAKKHIGIVTMEDVLEELFGEIYDEKDRARFRTVPPGVVSGETAI
jgi:CBS domain containing-hemolysin-like protein